MIKFSTNKSYFERIICYCQRNIDFKYKLHCSPMNFKHDFIDNLLLYKTEILSLCFSYLRTDFIIHFHREVEIFTS